MAYDPTAWVDEKARKLVKLAKEHDEEIAVEMLALNLKVSYQDGYRKGFDDALSKRPPAPKRST